MVDSTLSGKKRRQFLGMAGATIGTGLLAGCLSENTGDGSGFPNQDMELIIGFGPGGGYDEYSRLAAPHLEEYFDDEITVNPRNIEGSGGRIATDQVANSEPDGYTHTIVNLVNFALTQITEETDYDLREFTTFAQVTEEFRGIAVGADSDIDDWDDFVAATQDEDLNFASTGPGSDYVTIPGVIGDLGGLYSAEKVMENQVVYGGRSEALQGILGGDAHAMAGSFFSLYPFVESGDLEMIMACTTEDQPPEETPDAETFSSANIDNGVEIQDMLSTRRIFAGPPGIPDEETEILRDAYATIIQSDELQAEAEEIDRPIVYEDWERTNEAVTTFINEWSAREELLETLFP